MWCDTELQVSAGPEPQHSTDGEGRSEQSSPEGLAEAEIGNQTKQTSLPLDIDIMQVPALGAATRLADPLNNTWKG